MRMSTGSSSRCLACRCLAFYNVAIHDHFARLAVRNLRPLRRLVRPFGSSVTLRSEKDDGESPPKTDADKLPWQKKTMENKKKSLNEKKSDSLGQELNKDKSFKETRKNMEGRPPQAWRRDDRDRPPRGKRDDRGPLSKTSYARNPYRKKISSDMQRKVGMGESFLKFQKEKFMGFQWSEDTDKKEVDYQGAVFMQREKGLERMFQGIPFDIFTEDDYKNAKETVKTLFDVVAEEERKQSPEEFPLSAFDEQLQWTKQGKLWHFPIDNEQGWEEEKKYSFQDHVFFDEQLQDFPKRGPVRHFMELVTNALAKNHHLTVEEKHETIEWYKNYFMKQEKLLMEKFGEEGAVKSDTNTGA